MSHALGNEVVDYNMELEKSTADIQILVDEVKEDVQKTLDEFQEIQSVQNQRLDKLEDAIDSEVNNLKKLLSDLNQQFEVFKQSASSIAVQSLATDDLDFDKLNHILESHESRLEALGQLQTQIDQVSAMSPEKLREELISGIRMLGDRVSKAISEINERIDSFTDEIHSQVSNFNASLDGDEG